MQILDNRACILHLCGDDYNNYDDDDDDVDDDVDDVDEWDIHYEVGVPMHQCLLFPGFDEKSPVRRFNPRQTMMMMRMLMIMMPITIIFNTSDQITELFFYYHRQIIFKGFQCNFDQFLAVSISDGLFYLLSSYLNTFHWKQDGLHLVVYFR